MSMRFKIYGILLSHALHMSSVANVCNSLHSTSESFWLTLAAEDHLCSPWMSRIAQMCVKNLDINSTPSSSAPLLKSIQTFKAFANKETLTHLACQLNSLPLTDRQIRAFESHNLSTILRSMILWQHKDILDIWRIYKKIFPDHESIDSTPFISWITQLFDLRIVQLPKPDWHEYVKANCSNLITQLKHLFPFITTETLEHYVQKLCSTTDQNELEQIEQDFAKELKTHSVNRILQHEQKLFINSLENSHLITASIVANIYLELEQLKTELTQSFHHITQLYSAQNILKSWDARNFYMLGGSDRNFIAHPIYGKMSQFNTPKKSKYSLFEETNLIPEFQAWDDNFASTPFPLSKFECELKSKDKYYGQKYLGLSDHTKPLTEFLCFEPKSYSEKDADYFYNQNDPLTVKLQTSSNQIETISGNGSQIIDRIRYLTKYDTQALYQATYNILLALAFTDNKFAQDLIFQPYPIHTTCRFNQNEEQFNAYGFLLSHIRSLLLHAMRTDEQFVDFVTTYFKQYGDEGEYDSLNQCRINTNVSSNMNYSFQTQFRHKKHYQTQTMWIEPFKTTQYQNLYTHNKLWTMDIKDLSKTRFKDVDETHKYWISAANEKLHSITTLTAPEHSISHYFPALSINLLKQIQLRFNSLKHINIEQVSLIEQEYNAHKLDRERADELIELYQALIKQSDIPLCLKKQLAVEVLPQHWLDASAILEEHPNLNAIF